MALNDKAMAFLRELECHLVTVEINVQHGTLPTAGIACARAIVRDLLLALDVEPTKDLPPIHSVVGVD